MIDFLKSELDIGFTFAATAKLKKDTMTDAEDYLRPKRQAQRAIESVHEFEDRIRDEDQRREINQRLAELEKVVSTL